MDKNNTKNRLLKSRDDVSSYLETVSKGDRFTVRTVGEDTLKALMEGLSAIGLSDNGTTITPDIDLPGVKPDCTATPVDVYVTTSTGEEVFNVLEKGYLFNGHVLMPYSMNGRTFGFTLADDASKKSGTKPRFTTAMTDKKLTQWVTYLTSDQTIENNESDN